MCQRCEDLEEQVAYLKSELGSVVTNDALHTLRLAMRGDGERFGRTGPAALTMVLYRAHGRALTKYQIMDALPPRDGRLDDDRDPKIVDVWVCQARKALSHEAIQNVWGKGCRLSPFGVDLVGRILGDIQPIPEATELQDKPPEDLRTMAALIAGILAHKDGDGGKQTAATFRRIADRLTGQPRIAA